MRVFLLWLLTAVHVDGVSTPAHEPKIRYWGKVAEESERGGEASALATNGWRVKAAPMDRLCKGHLVHTVTFVTVHDPGMAKSCPPIDSLRDKQAKIKTVKI